MMRKLWLWSINFLFLFCSLSAVAQSTSVTATVVDSAGTVWSGGTITYVFQGNGSFQGQYQWQGANLPLQYLTPKTITLDASGSATFSIPTSTAISPSNSTWNYTICPNATITLCQSGTIPSIGTSQNISSAITYIILPVSNVNAAVTPLAYADSQIKTVPRNGALYYNTSTGSSSGLRLWNGVSWAAVGGSTTSGLSGTYPVNTPSGTQALILTNGLVQAFGAAFDFSFACPGTGNVEIGYSLSNPTCNFTSYVNGTPASGTLSDGTNSVPLVSPYSSATLSGHTYTTYTVFTGSVTSSAPVQSASHSTALNPLYCNFVGVASSGTGSGANPSGSGTGNQCGSETATITGSGGTIIPSAYLGNVYAGQTFTLTFANQYVVLLLQGGCGHQIYVNNFGTAFNTTALTYTNILGGSQTGMCLYISQASITGSNIPVEINTL